MKTLKIASLLLAVLAVGCSAEKEIETPTPPVAEDTSYTYFMEQLYGVNSECVDHDYLKVECNNQVMEVNYGQVIGNGPSLILCHFAENNSGGIMCAGCEGHFADMTIPNSNYNILPQNLPVQIGSTLWSDPTFTVTEINFSGVHIYINIPKRLVTTLKTGVYKLKNSIYDPGASINLDWEVIDNDGPERMETGYGLAINPNKPYKLELVCINRDDPTKVRLTWKFEGTFAGKSFENGGNAIIYEIPIKGMTSYNIELSE